VAQRHTLAAAAPDARGGGPVERPAGARPSAVGVIPARYASSRFPGKPLAPIAGVPMLRRVWEGARTATRLREVWVATDDARIAEAAEGFGAPVAWTSPAHPTGTDRIAEVAERLPDAVVVNVQGDEPLIEGFVIDAAVEALDADPDAPMATLVHAAPPEALDDPHRVKVALDAAGRALWFSRKAQAPLGDGARVWQHVGLYAYRREFLLRFVRLPPTAGERAESLEQLRALEHGFPIRAAILEGWEGLSVDVPEDVPRVEARLRERGRC